MSIDGYTISDDPARLDLDVVHRYLSTESYWARGIPRDTVARSVAGSLCFGIYLENGERGGAGEQVGFARVITDRAGWRTFSCCPNTGGEVYPSG